MNRSNPITVNGRTYGRPAQPVIVICVDGCEPDYLNAAVAGGHMPYLATLLTTGSHHLADCVIPAFTNPNNISIITGAPPRVHGICGNFFLDPVSGNEVMMNEPRYLRAPTILAAFQQAGAQVAVVTAKDKLRRLLGNGLSFGAQGSVCFSSERADSTTVTEHGIDNAAAWLDRPVPDVYSAELSEFVFASGVKLLAERRPDLMYLSTTDYVQHKHAPGTATANRFYAMFDGYLSQLAQLGAVLVVTADHGMKAKHTADGRPNVLFLQTLLDEKLGMERSRVILPITDPYVAHHGALGSFATLYCDKHDIAQTQDWLRSMEGIEIVLARDAACARFELPPDRIGDLVVISSSNVVIGTTAERHDLSALTEPLRSHGGLSEQVVPLLVSHPTPKLDPARRLRNFDAFDVALNYATS